MVEKKELESVKRLFKFLQGKDVLNQLTLGKNKRPNLSIEQAWTVIYAL